ncbi:MAG: DUF3772 domain-containing protein, partial [Deltaproteobacteria bacterium]
MAIKRTTISQTVRHLVAVLVFALVSCATFPHGAAAQNAQNTASNTEAEGWDATARRAEEAISSGGASVTALESLLAELIVQRDDLATRIDRGSIRSQGLRAELDALGPLPENGATEPDRIIARRVALNNEIAEADAPLIDAKQAHDRAVVLITAINKIIRERTNKRLFDRTASPLNPKLWPPAVTEVKDRVTHIATEIRTISTMPTRASVMKQAWPTLLGLLVAAGLIAFLIMPLTLRWLERPLAQGRSVRAHWLRTTVTLIARLMLPIVVGLLVLAAWTSFEMRPYSLRSLSMALPQITGLLIGSWWIADMIFAPGNAARRVIAMSNARAASLSHLAIGLGLVLATEIVLEAIESDDPFNAGTGAILATLVVLAGSTLLFRLAGLLRPAALEADRATDDTTYHPTTGTRLLAVVVPALRIAAVAAVAASLFGYVQLARQAMVPAIYSLALAGLAVGLHRAI